MRDKLKAYGEALFAQQPAEGGPGLSDDQLIDIGGNVGLIAPSFAQCVRRRPVRRLGGPRQHRGRPSAASTGTPTVFVDGKQVERPTPDNIAAAVAAA